MVLDYSKLTDESLLQHLKDAIEIDDSLLIPSSNTFFENIPILSSSLRDYKETSYKQAFDQLSRLNKLDQVAFQRFYKGQVFFDLAYCAFLEENYESAIFFLDAAASEDFFKRKGQYSQAVGCLTLDDSPELKRGLVLTSVMLGENYLPKFLEIYSKAVGSNPIDIDLLKKYFLKRAFSDHPKWRPLVTSWLVFSLNVVTSMRFRDLISDNDNVDFLFAYLLRGCLLFESLLKSEPTGTLADLKTLGGLFCEDAKKSKYSKIRFKLIGDGVEFDTSRKTFHDVVENIGVYSGINGCLNLAYDLRNTVGHNLVWDVKLTYKDFVGLIVAVSTSCLHVISVLYCPDSE